MNQNISSAPDPLLDAAQMLMARQAGLPGVREIAAVAGVSASLISYRFGGVEELRRKVLARALAHQDLLWQEHARVYLAAPVTRYDLSGLLSELLLGEIMPDDSLAALRWLRILHRARAAREGAAVFAPGESRFWAGLADQLDLPPGADQALSAFYHGLAFGHLIGGRTPGFHAWSTTLIERFSRRLLGEDFPGKEADSAWRLATAGYGEREPGRLTGMHPTRRAILEAAVEILLQEGTSALTHRRLAAAAEASVSSVIHFFETRRAILREAYWVLCERLRDRALQRLQAPAKEKLAPLTPGELAQQISPTDPAMQRTNERELAGLLNAMFEASREAETRQIAVSLFAHSGETSRSLLARLPGHEHGVSWR